jgi:exodeoxyribonuclease-3
MARKGFNGVAVLARAMRRSCAAVGLPGDPDDTHSRYIEAEVDGVVVGSLYLPNGNPVGTEKFEYKLRWMDRLREHAEELLQEERPVSPVRRLERGAGGSRRLSPSAPRSTMP